MNSDIEYECKQLRQLDFSDFGKLCVEWQIMASSDNH